MAEANGTDPLTRAQKKRRRDLERLRAKFGSDAVILPNASAGLGARVQKTAPEASSKSADAVIAPDGSDLIRTKVQKTARDDPSNSADGTSTKKAQKVTCEAYVTSVGKKRLSSINIPRFAWTGRNDVEVAKHILIDFSLRCPREIERFLERELSTFDASTTPEQSAFLGAALLHCASQGMLSNVQLLLARGAPVEYVSTDVSTPRSIKSQTPLELASARGWIEVCRVLLKHGAALGRAREAAARLSQFGKHFEYERLELLALLVP